MFLFTGNLKSGLIPVKASCESLGRDFPALMRHAVVLGVRVPGPVRRLDDGFCGGKLHGYAMCLNHWLRFLPVPVVLLNAEWFADEERFRERYEYDVSSGYHPGCGCPARYVVAHEVGHFIYGRMSEAEQEKWGSVYEPGKPSGYSTTPEESFCEAFAGGISGLPGLHFEQAATLAEPYQKRCLAGRR